MFSLIRHRLLIVSSFVIENLSISRTMHDILVVMANDHWPFPLFLIERIVMTPKKKTRNSTTLMMERKVVLPDGKDGKVHIAGGSNAGIVVNKDGAASSTDTSGGGDNPAHLFLEFRVFLVNANTKRFTQEKRRISFWFKEAFPESQRAYAAQEFFKTLVSPIDFPRGDVRKTNAHGCVSFHLKISIFFCLQITLGSSRR